jgi:hypothetical protein
VLAKQGGEFCVMCGRSKRELIQDGHKPQFCIDCKDNSGDHKSLDNLQLLCRSCNTKKNHPETDVPFNRVPTPEMIVGKKYEKNFRRWVNGHYLVNANTGLEYSYLINSGAEKVGCSPETIKRYLNKMTSSEGMYEWEERFGGTLLVLKPEHKTIL